MKKVAYCYVDFLGYHFSLEGLVMMGMFFYLAVLFFIGFLILKEKSGLILSSILFLTVAGAIVKSRVKYKEIHSQDARRGSS